MFDCSLWVTLEDSIGPVSWSLKSRGVSWSLCGTNVISSKNPSMANHGYPAEKKSKNTTRTFFGCLVSISALQKMTCNRAPKRLSLEDGYFLLDVAPVAPGLLRNDFHGLN